MNSYIAITLIILWLLGFFSIFFGKGVDRILKNWGIMKTLPPNKSTIKVLYVSLIGGIFVWGYILKLFIGEMTIIEKLRLLGPFIVFVLANVCIFQSDKISENISPDDPYNEDEQVRPGIIIFVGIGCLVFSYMGLWGEVEQFIH